MTAVKTTSEHAGQALAAANAARAPQEPCVTWLRAASRARPEALGEARSGLRRRPRDPPAEPLQGPARRAVTGRRWRAAPRSGGRIWSQPGVIVGASTGPLRPSPAAVRRDPCARPCGSHRRPACVSALVTAPVAAVSRHSGVPMSRSEGLFCARFLPGVGSRSHMCPNGRFWASQALSRPSLSRRRWHMDVTLRLPCWPSLLPMVRTGPVRPALGARPSPRPAKKNP